MEFAVEASTNSDTVGVMSALNKDLECGSMLLLLHCMFLRSQLGFLMSFLIVSCVIDLAPKVVEWRGLRFLRL